MQGRQYITDAQADEMQRILGQEPILVEGDFDGTNAELDRKNPMDVTMNPTSREAFRLLGGMKRDKVHAGILTGRDIPTVQRLVGLPGLLYTGYHGMGRATAFPASLSDVTFVPEARPYLERTSRLLERAKAVLPKKIFLEPKEISLALNIGSCQDKKAAVEEIERKLRAFAEELGFRWTHDVTTVEFLPKVDHNKGTALLDAVKSTGAKYVVFSGDSMTDLPALLAIKRLRKQGIGGIGVVARREDTRPELLEAADILVPGVSGMAAFMMELVKVLRP